MAQEYPQHYFRSPLDINLSLSATFGEVRANHYHSGLDIRTNAETGYPVYAVAEGYVSRIKVSAWGGGKILYIDHPNGYRSVYMHLDAFSGKIAQWVNDYQYSHHRFDFDTNIAPGLLSVSKGEEIARSGNSGSSGGPHLHFELRHSHNDQTINAQLFGIFIDDQTPPTIKGIRIYPADSRTLVNGKREALEIMIPAQRKTKKRKARRAMTLSPTIAGPFYIGIYTTDQSESYHGNNGVYRIELRIDDKLVYHFESETFRFEDSRSVNAIMDYPYYCLTRRPYILTRTLPFAPITSSHPHQDNGIFSLAAGDHTLRYDVYDINGNHTSKTFSVKCTGKQQKIAPQPQRRPQRQILKTRRCQIDVPAEVLYTADSLQINASGNDIIIAPANSDDVRYAIPPHVAYTLRLTSTMASALPRCEPRQIVIARRNGKKLVPLATTHTDKWFEAQPRDYGTFTLAIDTTAPTILPPKKLAAVHERTLVFRIRDDFSGLQTYNCYLNGRWILAEYDGKTASLLISLPREDAPYDRPRLSKQGENILKVIVADACGNTTERDFVLQ